MSTSSSADLHEKIRIKAYLLWEKAGCPGGDGHVFWVEAEKVITRMAKLHEAKKAKALANPKLSPKVKKAKPAADPVVAEVVKPEKKKKKKKDKSDKKKSDKKKEKK